MKKQQMVGRIAATTVVTVLTLFACAKPANEANGDTEKACEMMKDLVRICYDESGPEVACSQLTGQIRTEFSKYTSDGKMLDEVSQLCGSACDARKDGRTWTDLNQRVDCRKIASR